MKTPNRSFKKKTWIVIDRSLIIEFYLLIEKYICTDVYYITEFNKKVLVLNSIRYLGQFQPT